MGFARWLTVFLASATLDAHPAIGIFANSSGAIFYSDNVHVWRIDAGGTRSVAVADVHTHELWLDADGNLYGEHLWYEGERTNRWGHRVWRRSPGGRVEDVISARAGFREDYGDFSFVRSSDGWMYWVVRQGAASIVKRARPGVAAGTFAELGGMHPGWLALSPRGDLLFAARGIVYRISPSGKAVALHRRGLGDIMGLWADEMGSVYAALPMRRDAVRITPDGVVSTVATSPAPWRPAAGLVTPSGELWLLEFNAANEQRARRHRGN